jgi:hypothetical protein
MDRYEWLRRGILEGWMVAHCGTHDYYMTEEETDIETEHGEVCYTIYRFVDDES